MKLWLLSQDHYLGMDSYDSIVVAAKNEAAAKQILPHENMKWGRNSGDSWAESPEQVTAELIGTAVRGTQAGVIITSFHAG